MHLSRVWTKIPFLLLWKSSFFLQNELTFVLGCTGMTIIAFFGQQLNCRACLFVSRRKRTPFKCHTHSDEPAC